MYLLIFSVILNAQFPQITSPDMIFLTRQNDFSEFSWNENNSKINKSEKLKSAIYSLILPGWGQLANKHETAAWIFIGIELASWSTYFVLNHKADNLTEDVEAYVNDPINGFSRIQYYDNYYFKKHGNHLSLNGLNEEEQFQNLLADAALYSELKQLENEYGDEVHSLPDSKTQQYYEMVGKYKMFYHGWRIFLNTTYLDWQNIHEIPGYIQSYYQLRQRMNDTYKHAGIAVSVVILNHLASAIQAYIGALSFDYEKHQSNIMLRLNYDL